MFLYSGFCFYSLSLAWTTVAPWKWNQLTFGNTWAGISPFGMSPVMPEQNQFSVFSTMQQFSSLRSLPAKLTMNQQHVMDLDLMEAPASIRHCPPNLLNNAEWLPECWSNDLLCQKPTKHFVFSFKNPAWLTEDFVTEAGCSLLAVSQAIRAHSDGDVCSLCLYKRICVHISVVSSSGPSIRTSFRYTGYLVTHSGYKNFSLDQQEMEVSTSDILLVL